MFRGSKEYVVSKKQFLHPSWYLARDLILPTFRHIDRKAHNKFTEYNLYCCSLYHRRTYTCLANLGFMKQRRNSEIFGQCSITWYNDFCNAKIQRTVALLTIECLNQLTWVQSRFVIGMHQACIKNHSQGIALSRDTKFLGKQGRSEFVRLLPSIYVSGYYSFNLGLAWTGKLGKVFPMLSISIAMYDKQAHIWSRAIQVEQHIFKQTRSRYC